MPSLTIGMPLYNNARTLVRALDSLRLQTFSDFVVVMSDDTSTDETASVAEKYCQLDNRFTFVRQSRNLNYGNFRFVLGRACTEYFMFAAGDDIWEPTFIEMCIAALRKDRNAVCAVSQVTFLADDGRLELATGTGALPGSPAENIRAFFSRDFPTDNCRMYGVFRTAVAQRACPERDHHAWDYTFSVGTLLHGTHVEIQQRLMLREKTPSHRYMEYVRRDGKGPWRVFPLLGMTIALLGRGALRLPGVTRTVLAANLFYHMEYTRRFHPLYSKIFRPVVQRIYWRVQCNPG